MSRPDTAAPESLEELLARLEEERVEADRLYGEALTALDRTLQQVPPMPDPPPEYDEHQIDPINGAWNILPDGPPALDGSLKGRRRENRMDATSVTGAEMRPGSSPQGSEREPGQRSGTE